MLSVEQKAAMQGHGERGKDGPASAPQHCATTTTCCGSEAHGGPMSTRTDGTISYLWHTVDSTDSSLSEDTQNLMCPEQLDAAERDDGDLGPAQPLPKAQQPVPFLASWPAGTDNEEQEVLRNEMARERLTAPVRGYMAQHAQLNDTHRTQAVVWIMRQGDEMDIRHETLFLALSYLDRFLSVTMDHSPLNMDLLRATCLALACKNEEVSHSHALEWARTSVLPFGINHVHMERIVLSALDWRVRTPSPWTFLFHFCFGCRTCPPFTISMAAYLLELSMLEPAALGVPYSSVAAAALVISSTYLGPDFQKIAYKPIYEGDLAHMAPGLNLSAVQKSCTFLARLHRLASLLPPGFEGYTEEGAARDGQVELGGESLCAYQVLGLARTRAKYSGAMWQHAGTCEAATEEDLAHFLQFLV